MPIAGSCLAFKCKEPFLLDSRGVETKAANALKNGEKHGTVAAAVYDCIARTLAKLVKNAIEFETENAAREVCTVSKCSAGDETALTKSFLFAGGVASAQY